MRPKRAIYSSTDLKCFIDSSSYARLNAFIRAAADAITGVEAGVEMLVPEPISRLSAYFDSLHDLVDAVPPLKQPQRFGNTAFRTWHTEMMKVTDAFLASFLPAEMYAQHGEELSTYLSCSFGNETRIDYGTGHETFLVIALMCLYDLGVLFEGNEGPEANATAVISTHASTSSASTKALYPLTPQSTATLRALVLSSFTAYMRTVRRLQKDYMLEPAGSHGVWGLDDYQCLVFVWGAAQLRVNSEGIVPGSIHDAHIIESEEYCSKFLYLAAIRFIKKLKSTAPFSETSPMLNDISGLSDWNRVYQGLLRLYDGEVLNKLPVSQHLLFGALFPCTWSQSEALQELGAHSSSAGGMGHPSGVMGTTAAPGRGVPMHGSVMPSMGVATMMPTTRFPMPGGAGSSSSFSVATVRPPPFNPSTSAPFSHASFATSKPRGAAADLDAISPPLMDTTTAAFHSHLAVEQQQLHSNHVNSSFGSSGASAGGFAPMGIASTYPKESFPLGHSSYRANSATTADAAGSDEVPQIPAPAPNDSDLSNV